MSTTAPTETEKPKRGNSGFGAVEAILTDHARDIARVESDVAQLRTDVKEIKDTNALIFGKLDKMAADLAKAPHVPSFKDIATNVVAVVMSLGAVTGLLMWWNAVMFNQYAAPLKSAQELAQQAQRYEMESLRDRVHFLESSFRFKPEFREWAGR